MSIAKIEARAREALGHPSLKWIKAVIPKADWDSPRELRSWLTEAAMVVPSIVDEGAYQDAVGAVQEVEQTRDLRDAVARAYHDPKLRAEIGVERLEQAWRDPETAYHELITRSAAGRLSPSLDAALNALGGVREFSRAQGEALPTPTAAPLPRDAGKQNAEYGDLIKKSITPGQKLTAAEQERLQALAGRRVARENAAGEAAAAALTAPAAKPDAYQALIKKSVTGPLTDTEQTQLHELATSRAEAAGLLEQPEAQEAGHEGQ